MSRWLFLAVFTLSVTVGSWCFLTTSVPESTTNGDRSTFALNWSLPDPNVVRAYLGDGDVTAC